MKRYSLSWLLLFFAVHVCAHEIHSPKPVQASLTVYRPSLKSGGGLFDIQNPDAKAGGIALVSEIREVDLPEGETTLVFDGVAQTLVPQSARVESLNGVISEANFDYSLITPGDIIAYSIGEKVRLVRTDETTGKVTEEQAVLTSGPDGVVLDLNGRFEALDCSGEHEKIIFHSMPPNLTATPHLSARVRVQKAGKRQLKLSYLATGFDWRAQYVARVNPVDNHLSLTGWVTLVNQQTTSFFNVPVDVVAGEISIDEDTTPVSVRALAKSTACWFVRRAVAAPVISRMMAAIDAREVEEVVVSGLKTSVAEQRELGDYKLYRLPAPTDVLAQQIKQVKMLDEPRVAFEKIYFANLDDGAFPSAANDGAASIKDMERVVVPMSSIRLQNKKLMGLGKPIPAGSISVMGPNGTDGSQLFIGEDEVRDTPVNLPLDIVLGEADHIEVHPAIARDYTQEKNDSEVDRSDRFIVVSNHKSEAITLELRMDPQMLEGYRVIKESASHHFTNGSLVWTLIIPAGQQAKLTYTLEEVY